MENTNVQFEAVSSPQALQRCAHLADVIWHECYAHILKPEQIDYMVNNMQSAAALKAQIENEGYEYFIVTHEGADAGYIGIQAKDEQLLLSKLYLEKSFRGKHLGEAAMKFVEQAGRERACVGVWLTVNRFNERAISIYRKTGYQLTRQQQVDIGGGFVMDDFVFEKPL